MSVSVRAENTFGDWLEGYRAAHPERLHDPGFAAWLEAEYVPIAGGWQY
jgi:hypothetical protein